MKKRVAIVLFNLGGPDGQDDVQPFLFNLFNDKAIIGAPQPIRWLIATLISNTRRKEASENYQKMGGGSPLLPETQKQADALSAALISDELEARCFIAMRYWKPFTADAVAAVKEWAPDEIILLPLYPQFSTTTTGSSAKEWKDSGGPEAKIVCCYPTEEEFISAHAEKISEAWQAAGCPENVRVLLSAHGLPEKIVKDGDPYQWQIEQTGAAIIQHLPDEWESEICYQSRVGPLKWIGPATDDAIERAAKEGKTILITPVAFVSEHIETLVELDEEYAELAEEHGATQYIRAPALGVTEGYINTLAKLVDEALQDSRPEKGCVYGRICPKEWKNCPNHT